MLDGVGGQGRVGLTAVDFEGCDGLPFVHRHAPAGVYATTTQVDDEFIRVPVQSVEDGL